MTFADATHTERLHHLQEVLKDKWDDALVIPLHATLLLANGSARSEAINGWPLATKRHLCNCKTDAQLSSNGRHKIGCALSSQMRSKNASNKGQFRTDPSWEESGKAPVPEVPVVDSSFEPPTDALELLGLNLPPMRFIPRKAKTIVAAAASSAFSAPERVKWWMILAFGKLVLSRRSEHVKVLDDVIRRAKQFSKFEFETLLAEARLESSRNNKSHELNTKEFTKGSDAPRATQFSELEDCSHNASNVDRCIRLARTGYISRAMAAMSASPVGDPTPPVIAELIAKHPKEQGTGMNKALRDKLANVEAPRALTAEEVVKILRTFPPGSAAGPSGLLPSVLLSLMTHPGSPLGNDVASAVNDLMSGKIPLTYRKFFFGAKLVPLVKKDKALRPIACSEALRRIAAKALAGWHAKKFREILTPSGQIGVAVASGLEALAAWTRRSALALSDDEVVAKVDFKNAFNAVHRRAIAEAVIRHVPEIGRYVEAAYGEPSLLFCGDTTISSEMGAQQGDPLGPILFSIAALQCTVLPDQLYSSLRGCGWYLDDGLLIGPAEAVHKALSFIKNKGTAIGLIMNEAKTEILCAQKATWKHHSEFPCWRPMEDLELLGLPCSPKPQGLEKYVATFLTRVQSRTAAIEAVSRKDAHVGFLLLRMCTGFAAATHLARAQGFLDVFTDIDTMIIQGMDPIVPLGPHQASLARLPFRLGGLGLRSVALHAPTAFLAAHAETRELMELFQRSTTSLLPSDPLVDVNTPLVPECVKDAVARWSHPDPASPSPRPHKLQREFSVAIDDDALAKLGLDIGDSIRSTSCGSRGASLYLVGPVSYDDRLSEYFLDSAIFCTAIRLRLGLDVRVAPDLCAGCLQHVGDEQGHATLKCMKCGYRTRAHNALRDTLADICRDCLLSPSIEPHVSAKQPGLRADICFFRSGTLQVIDVAITHPFRDASTRLLASTIAGSAATSYEGVKVALSPRPNPWCPLYVIHMAP